MPDDLTDIISALGLLVVLVWPSIRYRLRLIDHRAKGLSGSLDIPDPTRPDTPQERKFRKLILIVLIAYMSLDILVLVIPSFPFVKDRRGYLFGLLVFSGLAIWHFLHLVGIVKRRTLWPSYVDLNTHENQIKEILVLRAHERGDRIPTVEEVRTAAEMSEAEFNAWFEKS